MFEWLKRLVARRELEELEDLRREVLMLAFTRGVDRHEDWIKKFAAESRAASHEWAQPCRWVPPEPDRDAPPRDQGVDYRFLGMTGEEES